MRKMMAYILIILLVCLNLNAIGMATMGDMNSNHSDDGRNDLAIPADVTADFELESEDGLNKNTMSQELVGFESTQQLTNEELNELGLSYNPSSGIIKNADLPPEQLMQIEANIANSNIGHLFHSTESNLAPSIALEPIAPSIRELGNIKVNNEYATDIQYQPSVAVGPVTGNVYVTWIDNRIPNSSFVYFARSVDTGKTFQVTPEVNTQGKAYDPTVAVDSTEVVYLIWSDDREEADINWDIYLINSTDYGLTWSSEILVNQFFQDNQIKPAIAISPNDVIYVVYRDSIRGQSVYNADVFTIVICNSTDNGATFGGYKEINTLPGDASDPDIAVDQLDYAWVVWSDNRTANTDYNIYFTRTSQPGLGGTFNTTQRVDDSTSGNQMRPAIAVEDHNKVYVVWEDDRLGHGSDIYFAKYQPASNSFAANKRINDDKGDITNQLNPSITLYKSTGYEMYLTWLDERNGYYEMYFAKSTNKGTSFTQRRIQDNYLNLNIAPMLTLPDYSHRPLAVHPSTGDMYVIYADNRSGYLDLFMQKSGDSGTTWSEGIIVNENDTSSYQGIDLKYNIAIGPAPQYTVHIVWTDCREDAQYLYLQTSENRYGDIYYSQSNDFGLTFSKPTRINNINSGPQRNPSIAVNDTNWVCISWTEIDSENPEFNDIKFSYSMDGGKTFDQSYTNIQVNPDNHTFCDESCVAFNSTGDVFVVYKSYHQDYPNTIKVYLVNGSYVDFFATFVFPPYYTQVNDVSPMILDAKASPAMAIDPVNNNIYVVWEDRRDPIAERPDIFSATVVTTAGPFTVSQNVRVNDTNPTSTEHLTPAIALNSNGDISVVWTDNRNSTNGFDIWYAKSVDQGSSYGTDVCVNAGVNSSDQTNPMIAIGDNDAIHVVWQDARGGDWDIYMANSTNGGTTFTNVRRVDSDITDRDQTNPTIAAGLINASNTVLVAWSDQRNSIYQLPGTYYQNFDAYFTRSLNDGGSYFKDYRVHIRQSEPDVAVADDGTVYAVWCDYRLSDRGEIYFAKSYTGGQHFSVNKPISQNTSERGRGDPQMVYKDDVIYVIWQDARFGSENMTLIFFKSTDYGKTFSQEVEINKRFGNQINAAFTVDKHGKIHIVWEDYFNPGMGRTSDVYYSSSTDNGSTWSTPVLVNSRFENLASSKPCIAINDSGSTREIYVGYMNRTTTGDVDICIAISQDNGATFKELINHVNDDISGETQANPVMDVGSNGAICMAWEDFRSGLNWDIYFAKSINEGINFSTNILVNESIDNENHPDIAIDPSNNNRITIIWQDSRNTYSNFNYNIYMATSTNGGTSFPIPTRIDDTSTEVRHQRYPKLALDSSGSIHTIWEDHRNDNGDIYYNLTTDRTAPVANAPSNYIISQGDVGQFIAAGS
ncbi:hypothetical protein, partial [[Eubacterium] cellulosolvens]